MYRGSLKNVHIHRYIAGKKILEFHRKVYYRLQNCLTLDPIMTLLIQSQSHNLFVENAF
jgi:hypothetical protein